MIDRIGTVPDSREVAGVLKVFTRCTRYAHMRRSKEPRRVDFLFEQLPDHSKEGSLQRIGHEPGLQPAAQEPTPPLLFQDLLRRLLVRDCDLRRLPCRLQNAERVGDAVGHARCGDSKHCRADELLRAGVRGGCHSASAHARLTWETHEQGGLLSRSPAIGPPQTRGALR